MTSRDRILHAITHQATDRLPMDLGGTRQSGIAAIAYARLRRECRPNLRQPFKVFDLFQMLAEIEPEMAEFLPSDTIGLNRPAVAFGIPNCDWKSWRLFDNTEVLVPGGFNPVRNGENDWELLRDGVPIARMPADGYYFDRLEKYPGAVHPDLASWSVPRLSEVDLESYSLNARLLFEHTDKAIIAALGPPYELFNGIGQGGFEAWMITFASEPNYVADLYQILTDAWIDNLKHFHEAVGDHVHTPQICDDSARNVPRFSRYVPANSSCPHTNADSIRYHANTHWKVILRSNPADPVAPYDYRDGSGYSNPVRLRRPA